MSDAIYHEPSAAYFEAKARETLNGLSAEIRGVLQSVVLKVPDFATTEQLASVELVDPWMLTGLYEGRPITEQTSWDSGDLPPVISLFRKPLLREWRETGVALDDLIRHVTIHEAGHHIGFSDDDMHALEDNAD